MKQERKQLGLIYHAVTTYLAQNHIQGEELAALEQVKDDLFKRLGEIDIWLAANNDDAPNPLSDDTTINPVDDVVEDVKAEVAKAEVAPKKGRGKA